MPITNISVNHDINEIIHVSKKKNSCWIFPFKPLGTTSVRNIDTKDSLEIISYFSKGELTLLRLVKDDINQSNEINIENGDRAVAGAIREWMKKGLIKRLRREYYIINPYFFTPQLNLQQQVLSDWNSI